MGLNPDFIVFMVVMVDTPELDIAFFFFLWVKQDLSLLVLFVPVYDSNLLFFLSHTYQIRCWYLYFDLKLKFSQHH